MTQVSLRLGGPSRGGRRVAGAALAVVLLLLAPLTPTPAGAAAVAPLSSGVATADAQPTAAPAPAPADPSREVALADAALHEVSKGVASRRIEPDEIARRLAEIGPIQAHLASAAQSLQPRLSSLDARLGQLGPAPAPGTEAPQIAAERRGLESKRRTVDGDLKQARLLAVEADQIAAMLSRRRNLQIEAQLTLRSRSVIDPGLWQDFAAHLPEDVERLRRVFVDQSDLTLAAARGGLRGAGLALAALIAFALAAPARIALDRRLAAWLSGLAAASRLRRSLFATGRVAVAALAPLAALLVLRFALGAAFAISPIFEQLGPLVIRSLVFAGFFSGLGGALLSADAPAWRLAPVSDATARRLAPYPALIGVVVGLTTLVQGLAALLGASAASTLAVHALLSLVEIVSVGVALSRLVQGHRSDAADVDAPEGRTSWALAAAAAWLVLAASLGSALLGYITLASVLMGELVWVATVLASLFLTLRLVEDLTPALLSPDAAFGRFLQATTGLAPRLIEQLGVLASGALRLALVLFGWAAILAPFGAGAGDVFDRIASSQLVFHFGQVTLSPSALFGAAALFIGGLVLTRMIRRWLERSYLPKTRLDVGARATVASGATYIGGAVAVVLTFAYLGLSFDRIALFASALSVGVGFGLQAVIGNFVSGLILLAERPVKVGDWVAIGELEGDIKRINVRATEIEMQDRSRLIVPNSDLVSKTVRNVTPSGSLGRIRIVLKVCDDADPAQVRDLIIQRLHGHPKVRAEPAPAVYLANVADGALEFAAFAYVDSPRQAYGVRSELLFQIVPELRAAGVAFAHINPVVNVAVHDRPVEPAPDRG